MRDRKPAKIDLYGVQSVTDRNKHRIEMMSARLLEFYTDPRVEDRKTKALCRVCYYVDRSRIGGAVMTTQPCGVCEIDVLYGSTATDVLCVPCGVKNKLCRQCGGDANLVMRRKLELKKGTP